MRALHVTLSYKSAPALGGPDLTVYKLCTALHRRGVQIDVICTNLATKTKTIQPHSFTRDVEGVHAHYLATRKLIPLGRHSFGLFHMPELGPVLRETIGCYDIVHIHGYRDYPSLVAYEWCRKAHVPFLIHPHGTVAFHGHSQIAKALFDRIYGQRMLRDAAGLLALSGYEAEQFRVFGGDPAKIILVPNGIDTADYDPNTSGEAFRRRYGIGERFVVLYLGRVDVIKGIDHMVRAVAVLRREGWDVAAVVVGPDEGFGRTLKQVASAEGFQHFYLLPTVSGREKLEAFGAADALVYASSTEGFGMVALEGILSGVPTVVAAGSGCGEIVGRLNAGFLTNHGDIGQLASILRNILQRPQAARNYTLAARPRVVAALDWSDIAAQVHGLYEQVCAHRSNDPLPQRV